MTKEKARLTLDSMKAIMEKQLFARLVVLSRQDQSQWMVTGSVKSIHEDKIVLAEVFFRSEPTKDDPSDIGISIRVENLQRVEWELVNFVGDEMYDFSKKPWLLTNYLVNEPSVALEIVVQGIGQLTGQETSKSVRSIPLADYRLLQTWTAIRMATAIKIHWCVHHDQYPDAAIAEKFLERAAAYMRDLNRAHRNALCALAGQPFNE